MGDKMNYLITFTFLDEKTVEVVMTFKHLKRFLATISKNEVFWDEGGGFWLAFSQLRYFTVKENKNAVDTTKDSSSPTDRMDQKPQDDDQNTRPTAEGLYREVWSD